MLEGADFANGTTSGRWPDHVLVGGSTQAHLCVENMKKFKS
jgi:hypothetical protein